MKLLIGIGLALVTLAQPSVASATTVIDFEDQPDSFGNASFPVAYQGVTWTSDHWLHYAPYDVNGYDPDGTNAIYAANVPAGFNSFTFADQVFVGASFSAPLLFDPRFVSRVFFQLYNNGSLVHTSSDLASASLTFLTSGYGGLVDEVRVFTVANGSTLGSLMTPGGSAWIMDNVTFDDLSTPVPEPATLLLFATGLATTGALRKRRPR